MQPKKQLKVQYIGIFEEIDSFYWPKMHFLKKGQKIRAWVDPPPLIRAMPERKRFFVLMSSLIVMKRPGCTIKIKTKNYTIIIHIIDWDSDASWQKMTSGRSSTWSTLTRVVPFQKGWIYCNYFLYLYKKRVNIFTTINNIFSK